MQINSVSNAGKLTRLSRKGIEFRGSLQVSSQAWKIIHSVVVCDDKGKSAASGLRRG